ncbi:MAG TPA: hypothetical protein VH062_23630, partial [Polyangiaceae bacterium]|nr:hypothetical protein [Polyangiaceae bacterium]
QAHDGADAAARDRSRTVRQLVDDPAGSQLRSALLARLAAADQRLEPSVDLRIRSGQPVPDRFRGGA